MGFRVKIIDGVLHEERGSEWVKLTIEHISEMFINMQSNFSTELTKNRELEDIYNELRNKVVDTFEYAKEN